MAKPAAATAIGDDLYLFRSRIPSEECLISAHGGTAGGNALFDVPAGVTVNFYTFHGFSLMDPGLALARTRPKPKEQIAGPGKSHDYFLSKYQGRHGGANETYDDIDGAIRAEAKRTLDVRGKLRQLKGAGVTGPKLAMAQGNVDAAHPFSVVTIRNRFFSGAVRLSDVVRQVRVVAPELRVFHCSFCRTSMQHDAGLSTAAGSSKVLR
jgi:hypothetical protein